MTLLTLRMTKTKTPDQLSAIAKKAVRTRRKRFPGGSRAGASAADVERHLGQRKEFSASDVMGVLGIAKDNATAVIAVLSGRGRIERSGTDPSGESLWCWALSAELSERRRAAKKAWRTRRAKHA